MTEIWQVNLQFATIRCGTVPFSTILASFLSLNAHVNGRLTMLFLCCCVRTGSHSGVWAGLEAAATGV